MNLYFTVAFRRCLNLFSTFIGLRTCSCLIYNASVQFQKKTRKISRRRLRSPKYLELTFHVVVLQRTATKCTKNYNARAQLLFCSLNPLFCGVLVAVAVVVCLRSLLTMEKRNVFALTPFNMQKLFLHLNLISIKEGNLTKALNTPYGVYILKSRIKRT